MEVKEYFDEVLNAQMELKRLKALKDHYTDFAYSLQSSGGSAIGGRQKGSSRVETSVIGMVDATAELDGKIAIYEQRLRLAERVIESMPHQNYRDILTYRYLCGMSWEAITKEIGYKDNKSVYKAHGYALKEAAKVLTDHY